VSRRRAAAIRPVLTVLLLALVFLAVIWLGQRRMIYFPFGDVPPPAAVGLRSAEEVSFTTEDGLTLGGWFVPANSSSRSLVLSSTSRSGITVIVFNGNGGHRGFRAPLAAALAERGIATLLFDYRGYGGNPGSPSEQGLARDARAARAYVAGREDVDARRLVYFGESLGAAVAVRLAAEQRPLALVLRSPFVSLADVGGYHYPFLPVRWLLRDRYPSIDLIGRAGCPVLVIAGDRDGIIPAAHSRRLYDAAREPRRLVTIEGADHNDLELLAGPALVNAVAEFLKTVD
jgi:fermentation-respiration switch protein FrsA (DUF1100 family)